jgi:hypothetical protein
MAVGFTVRHADSTVRRLRSSGLLSGKRCGTTPAGVRLRLRSPIELLESVDAARDPPTGGGDPSCEDHACVPEVPARTKGTGAPCTQRVGTKIIDRQSNCHRAQQHSEEQPRTAEESMDSGNLVAVARQTSTPDTDRQRPAARQRSLNRHGESERGFSETPRQLSFLRNRTTGARLLGGPSRTGHHPARDRRRDASSRTGRRRRHARRMRGNGAAKTFLGYGPDHGYVLGTAIARHDYQKRGLDVDADEICQRRGQIRTPAASARSFRRFAVAVLRSVYQVYVDTAVMVGRAGICLRAMEPMSTRMPRGERIRPTAADRSGPRTSSCASRSIDGSVMDRASMAAG